MTLSGSGSTCIKYMQGSPEIVIVFRSAVPPPAQCLGPKSVELYQHAAAVKLCSTVLPIVRRPTGKVTNLHVFCQHDLDAHHSYARLDISKMTTRCNCSYASFCTWFRNSTLLSLRPYIIASFMHCLCAHSRWSYGAELLIDKLISMR